MPRSSKKIQENSLFPYETTPQDPAEVTSKEEYRRRLAEYLKDPAFRQIEGFPIGTDEDILALSDPPYYTACPNPFLPEILDQWRHGRMETRKVLGLPDDTGVGPGIKYHREPFAGDVSEGKSDSIYNAHSYHTKVPHKAIMRYILHYTDPGDIIFDGFCGTGMTGVAAQMSGNKKMVEELGYKVGADGIILDENNKYFSRLGERKAILNDLSPAATFIAYNYNNSVDAVAFERAARRVLKETEQECGWVYETWYPNCDDPNRVKARINYTVWSDVFICPQCGNEIILWDVAIDIQNQELHESWRCPKCNEFLAKSPKKESKARKAERSWELIYDKGTERIVRQAKQAPVIINCSVGVKNFEKHPDTEDLSTISKIRDLKIVVPFPTNSFPKGEKTTGPFNIGLTNVHHFFTPRNLYVLATIYEKILKINNSSDRLPLQFCFSSAIRYLSKLAKLGTTYYFSKGGGVINAGISGTLYVPSFSAEINALKTMRTRIPKLSKVFRKLSNFNHNSIISSQPSNDQDLQTTNSVDYIFVDPPFGGNLMYSELNFLWEAWLKVITNNQPEAIVNKFQKKGLFEYQTLIEKCFKEFYRSLKHGHWMTIVFHNSQNSIWNSIQEALLSAGFMVADVSTLNKQQGSFNQATASGAVKQDLVITAYKLTADFENRFLIEAGSETGVWDFVHQHLGQLPLPALQHASIEAQAERMPYLLYDRMVAFHLVRGLTIPLSAGEFYTGLAGRYLSRDGMYFTSAQAAEYDRLRLKAERVEQLALFVTDEQSAIQWLRQELDISTGRGPQIYGDLSPHFIQQLHQEKYEQLPELKIILEQNFLQDEAEHWYVPDPDRQSDLEKLRTNALLHEFANYLNGRGRLRAFRAEAVRAGFSKAWKERQYDLIVQVAERLPEQALQEDAKLKMYYDNALGRAGRQPHQETLL